MVKTVLTIDGMACGMCESHVNDAIRNALRVKKVTSSHAKGETEILSEELHIPMTDVTKCGGGSYLLSSTILDALKEEK